MLIMMSRAWQKMGEHLDAIPNRILLAVGLRGTLGTLIPFLVLRWLDHPIGALFATIAGLNTNIADNGGPYVRRLRAMALTTLIMPVVIFVGTQVRDVWWLATGLMFLVALGGGMARTLGPTGVNLGMIGGLVYLIGMEVPGSVVQSAQHAAFYYLGGGSTILITLVIWRLRPYKRVTLEAAACFRETASLMVAVKPFCDQRSQPAADYEQQLVKQQQVVREALETSRENLGKMLFTTRNLNPAMNQLVLLLRAVSSISTATASLAENLSTCAIATRAGDLGLIAESVLKQLEDACRGIASGLVSGRNDFTLEYARQRLDTFAKAVAHLRRKNPQATVHPTDLEGVLIAFNQIMRHMESAAEAADRLSGQRHRLPGVLPPLHPVESTAGSLELLRANLSFDSILFRHALRVAAATAAGTALFTLLGLSHGIWIPLTTLLVLQPNFGTTWQRAIHRTVGTLVGAVAASLAVFVLHQNTAYEIIIAGCLFGIFFFIRRQYGVAVVFITTLIILLLDLVAFSPWTTLIDRVRDTMIGALLALTSGYVLWPSWERHTLPSQLASAIHSSRIYLQEVFAIRQQEPGMKDEAMKSRRLAELEVGNADAAMQRMLGEPKWHHQHAALTVSAVTHLRRLIRHLNSFAVHLQEPLAALPDLNELEKQLSAVLEDVAAAIENHRPPHPLPAIDRAYGPVRKALRQVPALSPTAQPTEQESQQNRLAGVRIILDFLLDRIIGDVTSLYSITASNPERHQTPDQACPLSNRKSAPEHQKIRQLRRKK